MDQQRIALFQKFLKALVFYTLIVILWGAWVRISHSGDGCGDTWPLCRGQLIPEAQQNKTWVEYAHRIMSGFYGIFVFGLYLVGRKIFAPEHRARRAGVATFIFMVIEALLGAKLVLFKLVGTDDSFWRLLAMSLHQINSLLLTGATVLWLVWSQTSPHSKEKTSVFLRRKYLLWLLMIALTGSWAALASTLFPSMSLQEGFVADFASSSHYFLKIRILHPLLALGLGLFASRFFWLRSQEAADTSLQKIAVRNSILFPGAMLFGILTLLFLAPVWMKITHLAIAQILWMSLVHYAVTSADSTSR